jgi:aminopeptidase N
MLRRKLGDDTFWKGIKAYYAKYKNGNANTADLKAELEQASGQNLNQFFKQWLYSAGHPQLEVSWIYDRINKTLDIKFEQKQDKLFEFPLEYSLNVEKRTRTIILKDRITEIQLQTPTKPASINIDPDVNSLVGHIVLMK